MGHAVVTCIKLFASIVITCSAPAPHPDPANAMAVWLTHTGGVPPAAPEQLGRWPEGPTAVVISSSNGARQIPWEETYFGKRMIEEAQNRRSGPVARTVRPRPDGRRDRLPR